MIVPDCAYQYHYRGDDYPLGRIRKFASNDFRGHH